MAEVKLKRKIDVLPIEVIVGIVLVVIGNIIDNWTVFISGLVVSVIALVHANYRKA